MEKFSKKLLMLMAAIFLGVAAFALIYAAVRPGWYRNIKAEITNQPYARTVTVSSEGKVYAKPDIPFLPAIGIGLPRFHSIV